ncbi:flagellar calcium-binding protein [Strigomonas culicis]|uniref:Flagellar calcium-binding protein n=1 Tax=Strigomonas culicis TaxID=28005 RepID=S9UXP0_9TRYP|nr:flagellar calcium-binding protein [Strigomonas culicis]|eukprot:EPY15310.1 flagellar calcium-binding protein [Strigomonas culicis]
MLVSREEFREGVPLLAAWGAVVGDVHATFRGIDPTDSGYITFEEFVEWATTRKIEGEKRMPAASMSLISAPFTTLPDAAQLGMA